MKTIQGKIPAIIIVCSLLTISACQNPTNKSLDKKGNKASVIGETPLSKPITPVNQDDTAIQAQDKVDFSDVLKKRSIRRSSDMVVAEEKPKNIPGPAVIPDKKQMKLLSDVEKAIKARMYEYAIMKTDAILVKSPGDEKILALRVKAQLLLNAERATKEKRYEDVIKITEIILKNDPDDDAALAFKEKAQVILEDLRHKKVMAQTRKAGVQERNKYLENLREKSIPYNDFMQFTSEDEWEDIKGRVQREDKDKDRRIEENREHTERLKLAPSPLQKPISQEMKMKLEENLSIEFINTPLPDVISFLQEKSKINFFLDKNAPETSVNIKLDAVPLSVILDYILPKGLGYIVRENIVHITVEPLELRVYDVRDLLINLEDRQSLTAVAKATDTEAAAAGEAKDTFDRVKEIIGLIVSTIEPESWSGNGGKGMIAAREGMLGDIVVTHILGIHRQVEDLLAALRSSADLQISIEARFIAVSDNFLESFGHNIAELDMTQKSASKRRGIYTETGDIFSDTGVSSAGSAGLNLTYQIFDGLFLKGFLKAVQESDEAETVTAPKITLSNTQRGTIKVVKTYSYVEKFEIVSSTPEPVIKEIDDGTTFNVRPIVSADRKYVYLEVHPIITSVELNTPNTTLTFKTVGQAESGTTAGVADNTIQLPIITKQELSVTVCVPDKGILMIGGLGKSTEIKTSRGVPILSKIPIIKRLFSSNTVDKDINLADNLIILIKPTILHRAEQEGRAFAKDKREVEVRFPAYGN